MWNFVCVGEEFLSDFVVGVLYLGIQLVRLPNVCKAPFDLYKIFNSVQQHGGFSNVSKFVSLVPICLPVPHISA